MVFICFFPGCKRKSRFKLPCATKFSSTRQKWLDFIGILYVKPTSRKGLCEGHFTPDQFIYEGARTGEKLSVARLKKNAVPTIPVFAVEEHMKGHETISPRHLNSVECLSLPASSGKRERPKSLELEDITKERKRRCRRILVEEFENTGRAAETGDRESNDTHEYKDLEDIKWLTEETENGLKLKKDAVQTIFNPGKIEYCTDSEVLKHSSDIEHLNTVIPAKRRKLNSAEEPEEIFVGANVIITDEYVSSMEGTNTDVLNIKTEEEVLNTETMEEMNSYRTTFTQTKIALGYTIENFIQNDEAILYLTGLENYKKFRFVLESLGPEAYCLRYKQWQIQNVTIEDQLFITLWKLRRNTPDFEMSIHFQIGKSTVNNIFLTWIPFMARQWRKLDIWPSRTLVNYYMPESFKQNYPKTRLIVDGTEIPIHRPEKPRLQQATFSSYKHGSNVKVLAGASPGGLLSYWSSIFGGSTSDRQVMERSNLKDICQSGDTIMADKGFKVQDIFAPYNIKIEMPTFLKGKNQFDETTLLKDRKLARYREHIERHIGALKTYLILANSLNNKYLNIVDDIVCICCMLCNLRECIMK